MDDDKKQDSESRGVVMSQTANIRQLKLMVDQIFDRTDGKGDIQITMIGPLYFDQKTQTAQTLIAGDAINRGDVPKQIGERTERELQGLRDVKNTRYSADNVTVIRLEKVLDKIPEPRFDNLIRLAFQIGFSKTYTRADLARWLNVSDYQARYFMRRFGIST